MGVRRPGGQAVAGALSALTLALSSGIALSLLLPLTLAVTSGTAGAANRSHARATTIHVSTTRVRGLGTVLTTGAGLTLYRFTENPVGVSTCTGSCATIWPPFLAAKGDHVAGPHGVKGLSVIDVGDGHWQVAFHHVALYRFEGDTKKGEAKGQGIGKVWFAVLKSGIPASAASASGGATTSSTAPSTSTSQPGTSTTPTHAPATTPTTTPTSKSQSQSPVTQAPSPPPPTTPTTAAAPPTTTPTTQPPSTTTTTPGGGGGYGY